MPQRLFAATPSTANTPCLHAIVNNQNDFIRLLSEFPEFTTLTFTRDAPKHSVKHHTLTQGPPIHVHARRLAPVN